MSGPGSLETIRAALAPHGLLLRGTVVFDGQDGPSLADGRIARGVVLVGHAGSSFWPHFSRWRREQPGGGPADPLDCWSKSVIEPVAALAGATAYFPSDPPYQPFQSWAMRAEGLKASPPGILIHPVYGLWHGYRGALGFADLPNDFLVEGQAEASPCEACVDKPCLSTCPADAIGLDGFRYTPCRSHLAGTSGLSCLTRGCLSRNACPVGDGYRYCDEQLQFHMAALKR